MKYSLASERDFSPLMPNRYDALSRREFGFHTIRLTLMQTHDPCPIQIDIYLYY